MRIHPEIASFIGTDQIIDYDFDSFFGICPSCNGKLIHYDSEDKNPYKAMYCGSNWKTCKLLISVKNFDKMDKVQDYFCRLDMQIVTNISTFTTTSITIDYHSDTITVNKINFPRIFLDIKNVDETLQQIKFWTTFS